MWKGKQKAKVTGLWNAVALLLRRTLIAAMRSFPLVFLMSVTACLMTSSAKTSARQPCVITYSIVERDTLGNVNQGESGKTLKWLTDDLERKYPGVAMPHHRRA